MLQLRTLPRLLDTLSGKVAAPPAMVGQVSAAERLKAISQPPRISFFAQAMLSQPDGKGTQGTRLRPGALINLLLEGMRLLQEALSYLK